MNDYTIHRYANGQHDAFEFGMRYRLDHSTMVGFVRASSAEEAIVLHIVRYGTERKTFGELKSQVMSLIS